MLTNLQEGQSVDSGIEIPRLGRSPDFDHRCPALPGLSVVFTGQLPYTVTASLRIHTGFPLTKLCDSLINKIGGKDMNVF